MDCVSYLLAAGSVFHLYLFEWASPLIHRLNKWVSFWRHDLSNQSWHIDEVKDVLGNVNFDRRTKRGLFGADYDKVVGQWACFQSSAPKLHRLSSALNAAGAESSFYG